MNKIKIGYFADGPWSHLAFEKIIQDYLIEIVFALLSGVRGINNFNNPSFIEASISGNENRLAIFQPMLKLRLAIPE